MSRADSKSAVKGETITTDDLNEKFSDMTTITSGKLDGSNFRNEAIDQPALYYKSGSDGAQGYVLKNYASMDNNGDASGASSNYPATVGPAHLSHTGAGGTSTIDLTSSPMNVERLDVLRVYWDLTVVNHNAPSSADIDANQTGVYWVVWLEWYVDGAWAAVPNQVGFNRSSEEVDVSANTQGTMIIPHVWKVFNPALGTYVDITLNKTAFRQAWYYRSIQTSTRTVSGFRLSIDGVYKSDHAGEVSKLTYDKEWPDSNSLQISQINMKVLHMGGG